jgi:hypothetical protein
VPDDVKQLSFNNSLTMEIEGNIDVNSQKDVNVTSNALKEDVAR